jgi:Ser/Thr protein kinase RdoA (MazF antagonist)
MVRDLRAHEWLTEEQHRKLDTALAAWRGPLARLRPFHLVHNDANRHNVMVTPEGQVVLIDLHRLSYEPFEEEVVNALYHFCRKDAALEREFLAAYLDRVDAGARAAWDFSSGFFTAINYLKRMHRRAHQNPGLPAADPKLLRWRGIVLDAAAAPRADGPVPA